MDLCQKKAYRLLSIRAHTKESLTKKLQEKGFSLEEIAETLEEVRPYLLEEETIFQMARRKMEQGFSHQKLRLYLQKNCGFSWERASTFLPEDWEELEVSFLVRFLEKVGVNKESYQKMMGRLYKKGFSSANIQKAISILGKAVQNSGYT